MSEAVPTTTRRKAYDASIQALGSTILHGVEGDLFVCGGREQIKLGRCNKINLQPATSNLLYKMMFLQSELFSP